MKLGVFDSGIGGVTVLQALRQEFPGETFAYFGDTMNVPYGSKSAAQIRALSESAAQRIRSVGVDALVVACNTASSLALPQIESVLGKIPVFGMVEAGVQAVVKAAREDAQSGPIVVFGTRATVRSGIYGNLLRAELPGREVFEQSCPLLVPIIEEGWFHHPVLDLTLKEYVRPYLGAMPGIALLACTHYPWIRDAFERALPGWKVVDSADAVASRLKQETTRLPFSLVNAVQALPSAEGQASPSAAVQALPSVVGVKPAHVDWYFSDPEVAQFIFNDDEPREIRVF